MPTNPEDHADESRGSTDNMSRTTPEDYKEFMNPNANLPVTSTIPPSRGSTPKPSLDAREHIDANTDCTMTSVQSNTGPLMGMAQASKTTPTPRRSKRVGKVLNSFLSD